MNRSISHLTRRLILRIAPVVLPVLLALALPASVLAHPLGNFTINHYSRIQLASGRIDVRYVLDMAEIPTFQEMPQIDMDGNGQVSDSEKAAYLDHKLSELLAKISLSVDGRPVSLTARARDLTFPAGQGGLSTLRLVADLEYTGLSSGQHQIEYRDENQLDHLGWREIVVQPGPGATILSSTVPDHDRSNELRTYPQDMLSSPLNVSEAHFSVTASGTAAAAPVAGTTISAGLSRGTDALAELITAGELSLPVIAVSLLVAFGLGAAHALSPGHGKTIVGAYLVGSHGTARHAAFLGVTVTVTHTIGVFALGLVTLVASQYIVPESLYPWLSLISGLLVVAIGLILCASRLRGVFAFRRASLSMAFASAQPAMPAGTGVGTLAGRPAEHVHPMSVQRAGTTPLVHSHGGRMHTHLPSGADGGPLTWRRLLALGISGGLLPCPSALIVLLSAIALHRVGFGLLLIVAFSAGLAATLTGIGLLMVYAGRLFSRRSPNGLLIRAVPVLSAVVITVAGLAITAQALVQIGILRL